ncbi:MAG: recombinase family protein [Candidatus Eremiobacterota bacterium]
MPAQKEKLINYCKAREWIISDIYIDPGYSGSNINRPAIQKLITEIKNFDIVLVYKLDRLSRSQKDTLHLIEDVFLNNKVDFVSLSEAFDTFTPFGRASIGILSVFAQLERENIKEWSKLGKKERAKNGLFHGGLMSR